MLLGRERELEAVRSAIETARAGSSAVLAVVGEPGIGKSALLDAAVGEADGTLVLRARGVASEASIPFAALSQLLRPVLGRVGELPAPQATALESALALRPAEGPGRLAVGAATLGVLAAAADHEPVVVLADDVHWLDPSSAEALGFAARRLLADSVAIIVAWREGRDSPLAELDAPVLRLSGLELDAAAALLKEAGRDLDADGVARLHRATAGNPLALLELARTAHRWTPLDTPSPLAAQLSEAYLARADRLPDGTRTALLAAAALDDPQLRVLTRALELLGLSTGDLAPAEDAGLLDALGDRLELRHPLVRSALYGSAAPAERRAVHRAIADALPDSEADRRAWHLALAAVGPDGRASSALEQAGVRARMRGADREASRAFERAAELQPDEPRRAALALQAADSAWLAGRSRRASDLLDGLGPAADDPALRVGVRHLRGRIALRHGRIDAGRVLLLEAADEAAPEDPDLAVIMLAEAAEGAFFAADAAGMATCAERARAAAPRGDGERAAFFAAAAAGMADVLAGRPGGAGEIREAAELAGRVEGVADDPRLLAWVAIGPLWLREERDGHDVVERALDTARDRAAAGALPHLLVHVGIAEAAGDRWIQSRANFDEAVRLARETGQRTILAGALARSAALDARCGREEACRRDAREALELARELGAGLFEIWALAALAELEIARGDADAACEVLVDCERVLRARGIGDPDLSPVPEQVELCLRLGRREVAVEAAAAFVSAAQKKGQPWVLARAHRCLALLDDDEETAEREFTLALEHHARTADVFQAARTELLLGGRRRRAGRRRLAREALRSALARFDQLGAHPWVEATDTELRATGETARRRDPSTIDDLTPQELRVALLLVGGRTTRETAAALFLSPKTIEYHLRNAYRKLGVSSRTELGGVLAERGNS